MIAGRLSLSVFTATLKGRQDCSHATEEKSQVNSLAQGHTADRWWSWAVPECIFHLSLSWLTWISNGTRISHPVLGMQLAPLLVYIPAEKNVSLPNTDARVEQHFITATSVISKVPTEIYLFQRDFIWRESYPHFSCKYIRKPSPSNLLFSKQVLPEPLSIGLWYLALKMCA